jgi:uncharacterized membrane protein SirB2
MRRRLAPIEIAGQNPLSMYSTLKMIHISFAVLSIAGFVLRGIWMFGRRDILDELIVRVAPHVVDTAFLATGIWLVVTLRLDVMQQDWLIAKFVALLLYVVFGAIALRRGKTVRIRTAAFGAALATYLYIVGVALQKSPASWLA